MNTVFKIWILLVFFLISCTDNAEETQAPILNFSSISKTNMRQGAINEDSLWVEFTLEDNDGDIGFGNTSKNRDITVKDLRTNLISDEFKLPDLPSTTGKKINATVSVLILTTCCLFPENIPPCSSPPNYPTDTIVYEIQVKDKAGHWSNAIQTPPIILICN